MKLRKHIVILQLLSCITFLVLSGCCFGTPKCNQNYFSARFRIVDALTGQDLAFGSARKYNPNTIKLYSINGADTVYQHLGAGSNPTPGGDSLLYASFDYQKPALVFLRLNSTDIDTLLLSYGLVDASPCCQDYSVIESILYNNKTMENQSGDVLIIKK
jgi:hypothetical protein